MGQYGDAAVCAVMLYKNKTNFTPSDVWDMATCQIIGAGTSSQKKGCPRDAFLRLCEDGYIKGIPRDHYTTSVENKKSAVDAVKTIKQNPNVNYNQQSLWRAVAPSGKAHNSQMDVVLTLWNHNLII